MKNNLEKENLDFSVNLNNSTNIQSVKKVRSSNIELLRFFLACCVITIHYATQKFWYLPFLYGAVNCFALISGYFLVKSRDDMRFLKFLPTILFLEVFNIALFLIFNYSTSYRIYTKKEDWIALIEYGLGTWWYIWGILMVYIISPFLNYGLQKLGKNKGAILIFTIWAAFQLQALLKYSYAPFGYYWGSFVILIYSYLLGGYLKLYGQNFLEQNKKILWFSALGFLVIQYMFHILYHEVYPKSNQWLNFSSNNQSLFALPTAFFMFVTFVNIPIKNIKFINFLGLLSLPMFAFQNGCLIFSNVIIFTYHLKSDYWTHCLISLGLLALISLIIAYPYLKYNQFNKWWIQKFELKIRNYYDKRTKVKNLQN